MIFGLATALATGTVLESIYDTPTAQYLVYRSLWFHGVLAALGINIFCVAVSRWPWKPKHIPFLLAHAGILMMLGGAWVTEKFGLDGNLRVAEGESVDVVELDERALVLTDSKDIKKIPVPWLPPLTEFKPIVLKERGSEYDVTIDKFYSHADATIEFVPRQSGVPRSSTDARQSAARLRLQGGPMNITQEFWLWMGDPSFRAIQMGPAGFAIGPESGLPRAEAGHPLFSVIPDGEGLAYRATSSDGKVVKGGWKSAAAAKDKEIQPGWRGNVRLTVLEWIPDAAPLTRYAPARIEYGMQAPQSAIHVISGKGGEGAETWLGVGDRAMLHTPTGDVEIGYLPKRVALPFTVRLDRFKVERYQGSVDPASYASKVTVVENHRAREPKAPKASEISMNEPLTVQGITLYQASYEDAMPRPTVSIFSVNQDPGRFWKYYGSLLLVFGSIALFAVKYRRSRSGADPGGQKV